MLANARQRADRFWTSRQFCVGAVSVCALHLARPSSDTCLPKCLKHYSLIGLVVQPIPTFAPLAMRMPKARDVSAAVEQTIDGRHVRAVHQTVPLECTAPSECKYPPAKPGALECEPLGSPAERAYHRTDVLDKRRALAELCASPAASIIVPLTFRRGSRPLQRSRFASSSATSCSHGVDRVHDPGASRFVASVVDEFVD